MFKGDIKTIADNGFSESEIKEVIIAMAKEELGSRHAIWNGIHRADKRYREIAAAFGILAVCLLVLAAVVLWKCL